jgi:DNA-binding NarL/FixJ family response regulator
MTKRQKLAKRFERLCLLLLSSGIRTASGKEESVANSIEGDADSRGSLSEASDAQLANIAPSLGTAAKGGYDVNVAGVRMISAKRRIREHPHAEFIVLTRRAGKEDVYVARRYGAFKKLHQDVSPPSTQKGGQAVIAVTSRVPRKRYPSSPRQKSRILSRPNGRRHSKR